MTLCAVPWQAAVTAALARRRTVSENVSDTLWKQNPSDSEEVKWALSTAEALLGRGERAEAIKWLRRAAEQASDDGADDRSTELAKAVGELAVLVASAPPPAPEAAPPPVAVPPQAAAPKPPEAAPPSAPAEAAPPPPPPPPPVAAAEPAPPPAADLAALQRKAPPLPARASAPPPIPPLPPAEKAGDLAAALAELSAASPAPQPVAADPPPAVPAQAPFAAEKAPAPEASPAPPRFVAQAVRVIVAPLSGPAARVVRADAAGHMPAGSFEAMLVGLSPDADLESIFSKK
jgi:hypothetical protein